MPQLLILATIGVGVWMGARWASRKARQIARDMEASRRAAAGRQKASSGYEHVRSAKVTELQQDPETGVYKVKKE